MQNNIGEPVPPDELNLFCLSESPLSSDLLANNHDEWSHLFFREDQMFSHHHSDETSLETDGHGQSPPLLSPASNPKETVRSIKPCSKETRSCMLLALNLLQALHIVPTMCFSCDSGGLGSINAHQRTTESILAINRKAVQLISNILQCPCFANFQMRIILTTICFKLIGWCRALINDNCGMRDDYSQGLCGNNMKISDHREVLGQVIHQPITVGEYTIDINLQPKIRAQVVLGELQHLEASIQGLSGCLENLPDAVDSRSGSISELAVRGRLVGLLREHLEAATMDVDAILNVRPL